MIDYCRLLFEPETPACTTHGFEQPIPQLGLEGRRRHLFAMLPATNAYEIAHLGKVTGQYDRRDARVLAT